MQRLDQRAPAARGSALEYDARLRVRSEARARRAQSPGGRRDEPATAGALAGLVADGFDRLAAPSRARMLRRLLSSAGSLALAVLGGGAFAHYIGDRARNGRVDVSIDDALRTTPTQVYELARYVEQSDPRSFQSLVQELLPVGEVAKASPA
jgi:hypothetical protein